MKSDTQVIAAITGHVMQGALTRLKIPDPLVGSSNPPQVAFKIEPGNDF